MKYAGYRPDIDGIRALAVLSVFLFHLKPSILPGGFLGVDVFFVISGYLISSIILRENQSGSFSFANFYARRVKRIFPALFVLLLLSGITAVLLLPPETYGNYMNSARYASAQLANFFFAREVIHFDEGFTGQPLLHTWTLGVEEQFYLVWPLFVVLCCRNVARAQTSPDSFRSSLVFSAGKMEMPTSRVLIEKRFSLLLLLLFTLSFSLCLLLLERDYRLAFYMFYTRAFEFCIGGFLALGILPTVQSRRANIFLSLLGLLMLIYSFLFIGGEYFGYSFLHFGVFIPCLGTALLLYTSRSTGIVKFVLASALPVFIGRISYSLYLYHWPVIIFWKIWSGNQFLGTGDCLLIFACSTIAATLSYSLVEQPARKTALPDRHVLLAALTAILVFAFSFKALEDLAAAPWRIQARHPASATIPAEYSPECVKSPYDGLLLFACMQAESGGDKLILLAGDSHALHFFRATTAWAAKNGYDVEYLGQPACPMLIGDTPLHQHLVSTELENQCQTARQTFLQEAVHTPRVEIVLIAQRFELLHDGQGYPQNGRVLTFLDENGRTVGDHTRFYGQRLAETGEAITEAGKRVLLLHQLPLFNRLDSCKWMTAVERVFTQREHCSFDDAFIALRQQQSRDFLNDLAVSQGIETLDPFPDFSGPTDNTTLLYEDVDHVNSFGFESLVPYYLEEMDRILSRKQ